MENGDSDNRLNSGSEDECYRSNSHANRIMQRIRGYAERRELCDVSLVAGNRRVPAHKLVLCAASDYFAAMFMTDVVEAKAEEVPMKNVDGEALTLLVHYIYTGRNTFKILFQLSLHRRPVS